MKSTLSTNKLVDEIYKKHMLNYSRMLPKINQIYDILLDNGSISQNELTDIFILLTNEENATKSEWMKRGIEDNIMLGSSQGISISYDSHVYSSSNKNLSEELRSLLKYFDEIKCSPKSYQSLINIVKEIHEEDIKTFYNLGVEIAKKELLD